MLNRKISNDIHNIQQILDNMTRQTRGGDRGNMAHNIVEVQKRITDGLQTKANERFMHIFIILFICIWIHATAIDRYDLSETQQGYLPVTVRY